MTALSVRMWITYDCECRNLRNLYFENLSILLEARTLMADELEIEKIAWAPFFKSLALWVGYLYWPVIWPVVVCIVFPKSHEQNCSFEYPVALAIVIGFFMPVVFGLKSRWFRKWSLAIVCFWIVYIFLLLVGSGVYCMFYSDIYLEFVDQEHRQRRSLFYNSKSQMQDSKPDIDKNKPAR